MNKVEILVGQRFAPDSALRTTAPCTSFAANLEQLFIAGRATSVAVPARSPSTPRIDANAIPALDGS
jgi:hypothetical protein